jgi:hypothetical protein
MVDRVEQEPEAELLGERLKSSDGLLAMSVVRCFVTV